MDNFITITGSLGSGKSTLCALLKDREDYTHIYAGQIFRDIAREKSISLVDLNKMSSKDFSLDYELDKYIKHLAIRMEGQKVVFDSRLAWYTVSHSYKIFVYCNSEVASERVFNDDRGDIEAYKDKAQTLINLTRRRDLEVSRYKREYGIDYYDFNNYDLVIDSSYLTIEEVYKMMMNKGIIEIEPWKLYPTQSAHGMSNEIVEKYIKLFNDNESIEPIEVIGYKGHYFINNGHHRAIACALSQSKFIKCKVIKRDLPKQLSLGILYDYQDAIRFKGHFVPDKYK